MKEYKYDFFYTKYNNWEIMKAYFWQEYLYITGGLKRRILLFLQKLINCYLINKKENSL